MYSLCVTGPISSSSQILSMYSGRIARFMIVSVQPWEWPTDATEGCPVMLRMKSIAVGRSISASSSMLGTIGRGSGDRVLVSACVAVGGPVQRGGATDR